MITKITKKSTTTNLMLYFPNRTHKIDLIYIHLIYTFANWNSLLVIVHVSEWKICQNWLISGKHCRIYFILYLAFCDIIKGTVLYWCHALCSQHVFCCYGNWHDPPHSQCVLNWQFGYLCTSLYNHFPLITRDMKMDKSKTYDQSIKLVT